MRMSKGGFNYDQIMRLSWRQFQVLLDSCFWAVRSEQTDGQKENLRDDELAMNRDPRIKERRKRRLQEQKRETAKHERFAESNPKGGETKNLLN